MTAFNDRLKPKRFIGFPMGAALSIFIALPVFVLGLISEFLPISIVLFIVTGILVIAAIFFSVLGDEAIFFRVMILANRENNNVTSETWTKH